MGNSAELRLWLAFLMHDDKLRIHGGKDTAFENRHVPQHYVGMNTHENDFDLLLPNIASKMRANQIGMYKSIMRPCRYNIRSIIFMLLVQQYLKAEYEV